MHAVDKRLCPVEHQRDILTHEGQETTCTGAGKASCNLHSKVLDVLAMRPVATDRHGTSKMMLQVTMLGTVYQLRKKMNTK